MKRLFCDKTTQAYGRGVMGKGQIAAGFAAGAATTCLAAGADLSAAAFLAAGFFTCAVVADKTKNTAAMQSNNFVEMLFTIFFCWLKFI